MQLERVKEKYSGSVSVVEIGSPSKPNNVIRVGGETSMPFMFSEGATPNSPVVAMEVQDQLPADWSGSLASEFGSVLGDPLAWAQKCVNDFGAKMLCVRLAGTHPDSGNKSAKEAAELVKEISNRVKVPLVIIGSGDDAKDNEVLPVVSQAVHGHNFLFGIATQNNYKTLAAICLADGHSIIAESPIDVNIAKQLNILISDMSFDPKRIVMHPTTTSLGYGMEYVYSIMERARLAAFIGDKMLSMPFILFIGQETWKTREAKESSAAQGVNWEIVTGVSMIQAGADIIVARHPKSAAALSSYIERLMKK